MGFLSAMIGMLASLWTTTLFSIPRRLYESQVDRAVWGCRVMEAAVKLHQSLDGPADVCPSSKDLVRTKKINPEMAIDPWGAAYRILCSDDVRVSSDGRDGKPGTPDDLRNDMTLAEVLAVKALR